MPWFRDEYSQKVWECDSLRPNEILVALAYADHAGDPDNPSNDIAWVVWRRLSQRTGIRSKDALSRALQGLVAAGWMELVEARKQHRSPRYRLMIPEFPEVRQTYDCETDENESEVRLPNIRPVDNQGPEVREADNWMDSEVALTDNSATPEVRETDPVVRETTARGTRGRPDFSTEPQPDTSTPVSSAQPQDARPVCNHPHWTADHDCVKCGHHEPCPDCRRLLRIGPHMRCHRHNEDHLEAS